MLSEIVASRLAFADKPATLAFSDDEMVMARSPHRKRQFLPCLGHEA
jgi:hypothetical protein